MSKSDEEAYQTVQEAKDGSILNRTENNDELNSNHMIMIALSGSLGIGLMIGMGSALSTGGPGSILIGYILVGLTVYHVMAAVGEVSTYIPMSQGFAGYASRYVDPCLGFAVGWAYWVNYLIVTPHQITAASMVFEYWVPREKLNPGVFISIFWVLAFVINYYGGIKFVKVFQYWISAIKIAVMAVLLFVLLIFSLGGGPDRDRRGFRYWRNPGAFKEYSKGDYELHGDLGRFIGFMTVGITAVFSYLGVELVGVTVGEASNPRKNIPRAVRLTFMRAVGFYIVTALVIGMVVPWNDQLMIFAQGNQGVGQSASAFIIAFKNAKVRVLPDIINSMFIVFFFAASVAGMFIGSKTLHALAIQQKAPRILAYKNSRGVPSIALLVTAICSLTCFLNVTASSAKVFDYFVSFSAILGLMTWMTILYTHICFMNALKAQNISRDSLPWKAPGQPFNSYFNLAMCAFMAISKNFTVFLRHKGDPFDWTSFVVGYIAVPLFGILCLGYKWVTGTTGVSADQADLKTGLDIVEEEQKEWDAIEAAEARADPKPLTRRIATKALHVLF